MMSGRLYWRPLVESLPAWHKLAPMHEEKFSAAELIKVHQRIAAAVHSAHVTMEACLEDVLALEGWDRTTLEMPANLQKRLLASVCSGSPPGS